MAMGRGVSHKDYGFVGRNGDISDPTGSEWITAYFSALTGALPVVDCYASQTPMASSSHEQGGDVAGERRACSEVALCRKINEYIYSNESEADL
jgi:hypothetical protein